MGLIVTKGKDRASDLLGLGDVRSRPVGSGGECAFCHNEMTAAARSAGTA